MKKDKPIQNISTENTMGTFLKKLSVNVGYSPDQKSSKSIFNPFSIDNSNIVCALYVLMNSYSEKQKNKLPLVPTGALTLPRNSGVKFDFNKEIDIEKMSETIEDKQFDNIQINNENSITILKNSIPKEK
jgi:hypothetical protein